jgi:hypothetical protein
MRAGVLMGATCLSMLTLLIAISHEVEWPSSDTEIDALLCKHSPRYKAMADAVRKQYSYRIVATNDFPLGNAKREESGFVIELNPKIPKARRATILIWEMANAFQHPAFAEITRRARSGEIATSREYGMRMELVEHGSHQLHLDVLTDLSRAGIPIAEDFLFFLDPRLKSLEEYRIPSAHLYLEAHAKSGHTKHYEDWYHRVIGKTPPPER